MEGYFNNDGVCEMCAANSFKNVSGNKNCTTCPSNYITQSTGATDENACGKTFLNISMNIFRSVPRVSKVNLYVNCRLSFTFVTNNK